MRVRVELDVCQGFGNCVMAAPELFALDDDDAVVVLKDEVPETERLRLQDAVNSCPVTALHIE